jgi:hypothetical protein
MTTECAAFMQEVPEEVYKNVDSLKSYLHDIEQYAQYLRQIKVDRDRYCESIGLIDAQIKQNADLPEVLAHLESLKNSFAHKLIQLEDSIPTSILEPVKVELAPASSEEQAKVKTDNIEPMLTVEPAEDHEYTEEEIAEKENLLKCELNELKRSWSALKKEDITRTNGRSAQVKRIEARIWICRIGIIQSIASEYEMQSILTEVDHIKDDLQMTFHYIGDTLECPPLLGLEAQLQTEDWEEMITAYDYLKRGQETLEWLKTNKQNLSEIIQFNLRNAIAACQQICFRTMNKLEYFECLQKNLFDCLQTQPDVSKLTSLHKNKSDKTLAKCADSLSNLLEQAEEDIRKTIEHRQKEQLRKDAIDTMEKIFRDTPDIGSDISMLDNDRQILFPAMDMCIKAGIPPSNRNVRELLIPYGMELLEGVATYKTFLKAVEEERKRRKLDQIIIEAEEEIEGEESITESDTNKYLQTVIPVVRDQRILIIGGRPRKQEINKLKGALCTEDVEWIGFEKGDRASKLKDDILKSFVTILVKKLASHEIVEKSREWVKDSGRHALVLPQGYGVNQIIFRLYEYITRCHLDITCRELEKPAASSWNKYEEPCRIPVSKDETPAAPPEIKDEEQEYIPVVEDEETVTLPVVQVEEPDAIAAIESENTVAPPIIYEEEQTSVHANTEDETAAHSLIEEDPQSISSIKSEMTIPMPSFKKDKENNQHHKNNNTILQSDNLSAMNELEPYKTIVQLLKKEQVRCRLEGPDDEDGGKKMTEADVESRLEIIIPFVRGKNILILGGSRNISVINTIKQKLQCEDIIWPGCRKEDKASKFEEDIKKALVTIIVKNSVNSDILKNCKEMAASLGGYLVTLPDGYGANQIIYHLYKTLCCIKKNQNK